MEIQKIKVENLDGRIETGPLQINEDWPGFFIRGDNAAYLASVIENYIKKRETILDEAYLQSFIDTIRGDVIL